MMQVAIVMGSVSDWPTMQASAAILTELQIPFIKRVISAHRMPATLQQFAQQAVAQQIDVIIAGAGGAAHLPGMLAANTVRPVIGVPIESHALHGMDSLLSIVQMPAGVPVATMAIGVAGAKNAALQAASILALQDAGLQQRLVAYRAAQTQQASESEAQLD
ncbi:5-(carboxyamino)imidazole ribonucleotide mutase [Loigolactobacillus jiayinensis]|uniref:N5-carboxyaminoimidazole ribonucleotide mutase n=1 Tax=Loigolactobacillus jiayinensis TaxID=2486016 RepID=A0ABW1RHW4_9LACO|nr:5-(carboxyamino)imidazole ribonucleotide mutase [Loigolactobacillus jiayinensis]